jgi:hypothetical protein
MSGGDHTKEHTALVKAAVATLSKMPELDVDTVMQGAKGAKRRVGLYPGTPDLRIIIAPGFCLWAEAKTGGATLTREQREMHLRMNRLALPTAPIAVVFHSVEELLHHVNALLHHTMRHWPAHLATVRSSRKDANGHRSTAAQDVHANPECQSSACAVQPGLPRATVRRRGA